jgi:hypothetical protein
MNINYVCHVFIILRMLEILLEVKEFLSIRRADFG